MKKYLVLLLVGLVTGYYLFPKFKSSQTGAAVPTSVQTDTLKPLQKTLTTQGGTIVITKLDSATAPEAPEVKYRVESFLNLHLEEPIIEQLENEKEALKNNVYVDREESGWKVHISEGSHFLKVGFKDGDVISDESLDHQLADPDRAELAGRFVALLSYLQR